MDLRPPSAILVFLGLLLLPAPLYPLAAGEGLLRFYAAVPFAAVGAALTVLGAALYSYEGRRA